MRKPALWLSLILIFAGLPALAATLGEELAAELRAGAATEEEAETLAVLEGFYRAREMRPLWMSEAGASAGPNDRARALSALLSAAEDDALDPDDYGAAAIDALLGASRAEFLADLEVRLSVALLHFAAHLGEGRVTPRISDPDLFVFRAEVDKAAVIAAAARDAAGADDIAALLDGYLPQTVRYDRLKAALADYRALAAAGGWPAIPAGPTLKPGMTDPRVALLRDRLKAWSDLRDADDRALAGGDPSLYDAGLEVAVKWMQYRHGLAQDGAVGRNSLAALNVPVEARIEQMILNLERRRWMPDDLGQRYIFVNLADFTLKLVDEPETILDTRVVVGKPYHMTPVFSHEMTYVVVNPYWHVPPSIARKELLPKIKQDVGYLAQNNFALLSDWSSGASVIDPTTVDWSQVTRRSFPYKLRQGSGDGNALGRIKFMFPNRFNVYLHDTPSKSLFQRAERSFSHGCIRVENPQLLAEVVLAQTQGWRLDKIQSAIESGKRQIVSLSRRLPVHVSYLTSWVNKDGSVHFRKDIYQRDAKLAEALLGPRSVVR